MDVQLQGCVAAPYRRRRPADTPLYRVVQNHLETFLSRGRDEWWEAQVPPHAERELRRFARPIPGTRPLPWGLARKSAPGGFFSGVASWPMALPAPAVTPAAMIF